MPKTKLLYTRNKLVFGKFNIVLLLIYSNRIGFREIKCCVATIYRYLQKFLSENEYPLGIKTSLRKSIPLGGIISSILLILLVSSCSKNSNTTPIDFGYNYYPLSVTERIYDVDSLVHNDNDDKLGVVDTFKYQVKEMIGDTFMDASGEMAHKFNRYYRNNATEKWVITDVWVLKKTTTKVELTEENEKLVKLNFPIELNKTWDGNVLNGKPSQNFEYTNIDQFVNLNNISYDSTLTVVHIDNLNIIEKQFSQEQYAKNVGLILKEKIFLDFQADSGLEFRMTLVSWN